MERNSTDRMVGLGRSIESIRRAGTGYAYALGTTTLLVLLVLSTWLAPHAAKAEDCEPVAVLISTQGETQRRAVDARNWTPAPLDQYFCSGDSIRTGPGSTAAVRMENETVVRLGAGTTLTFTEVVPREQSWLDLLEGVLHFISRVPRSLDVTTPYVNASVEGTEFVVNVASDSTVVTVLNGQVLASNERGEVRLESSESALAERGRAPVRRVVARPRDAVAWALYYPPLPPQADAAETQAARTVISAIANNDLERARTLIDQAARITPVSAATLLARSYFHQARFDIPAALADARAAVDTAANDPIARARLAEVLLMTGDSEKAREQAERAVEIDPGLSMARTVLGFASLRSVDLSQARESFLHAIRLDSTAPLPRFGLGLTKIRAGDLVGGREDLETAALLDPNNALMRSYLGKAYYEERRNDLAHEELSNAKSLDPNDPTAWFYESILLQSENRPVQALRSQQRAIALNERRAVYRSRQLLDQDNASRTVALGRIYNDLGFERLAINQATSALSLDPGNHSAHRLLADGYYGIENLDAARQSELLQSKLSQPLNLDPLQPQLNDSNLGLLDGTGPGNISYNEYNSLFTRNGWALQMDGAVGEKDTWSEDVVFAGLRDNFAFSVGQYHTETDGFRPNADYEQDIYNAFAQFALSDRLSVQFEINREDEEKGDVAKRLSPELLNDPRLRVDQDTTSYRTGLSLEIAPSTKLLTSLIQRNNKLTQVTGDTLRSNRDIDAYDVQLQHDHRGNSIIAGVSYNRLKNSSRTTLDPCFTPVCELRADFKDSQARAYGYYFTQPIPELRITGGITVAHDDSQLFETEETRLLPKLGLRWLPGDDTELRIAGFRTITSTAEQSYYQTLEPTHVAGFNQEFDEFNQTLAWNYGLAAKHQVSHQLEIGAQAQYREGESPFELLDLGTLPPRETVEAVEFENSRAELWLHWLPHSNIGLSLGYGYDDYETATNIEIGNILGIAPDGVVELKTHRIPIALSVYHPSGWSFRFDVNYYDQEGRFQSGLGDPQRAEDSFWMADLTASFRLPKRRGMFSIGIRNLFDESFRFEDRDSYDSLRVRASASPSRLSDERFIFAQLSINFRS